METLGTRERYINFYTDFAFKRLFGTEVNKELLINFLNALLAGEEVITDITYLNTEHFGTLEVNRKAVFDVYCKNDEDEYFIVEMQKGEQQFFKDRSVFYSTFPIREQAPKGDWDYHLKAVYTIGILNFSFDDTDDSYYHHEVKLMDTRTKKVFYDKLTYIYLEMPKFKKSIDELESIFDKWMYAIRHLPELLAKPKIMQEEVFTHLFEAAEIARFTPQEVLEYEESLKVYRDWYSITKTAVDKAKREGIEEGREQGRIEGREQGRIEGREQGRIEGREQGRIEGREQGRIEGREQGRIEGREQGRIEGQAQETLRIAKKMKSECIDPIVISKLTGIPYSEIDNL